MDSNKKELPHANGNAAQADGKTSTQFILPKNSTKIKEEIIRYLREEKKIRAKDMIAVICTMYEKYDKYLQSKVESGELYGIELRNDAIDALLREFAPERVDDVKRKRGGGHIMQKCIFARLPDRMYDDLQKTIRERGFPSVQSWLTYIVVTYISQSKEGST